MNTHVANRNQGRRAGVIAMLLMIFPTEEENGDEIDRTDR